MTATATMFSALAYSRTPDANRYLGCHIHITLHDTADGKNLFKDKSRGDKYDLSELAEHFTGGLIDHSGVSPATCIPQVLGALEGLVGSTFDAACVGARTVAPGPAFADENVCDSLDRIPAIANTPSGPHGILLPDG